MLTSSANVETAAFQVGYESASQFSREYTRMFGNLRAAMFQPDPSTAWYALAPPRQPFAAQERTGVSCALAFIQSVSFASSVRASKASSPPADRSMAA